MLAQILPGFRDFRTPLVTGYLWLATLWVFTGMPIPQTDVKEGPLGLINWLNGYTSSTALLAILSFGAYLVGILVTIDANQANWFMSRFGFTRTTDEDGTFSHPRRYVMNRRYLPYRQSLPEETRYTISELIQDAFNRAKEREVSWQAFYRSSGLEFPNENELKDLSLIHGGNSSEINMEILKYGQNEMIAAYTGQLHGEIPVLATKLQEKNERLFETYDRARSESEFRMSVAIPIFSLCLATGITLWSLPGAFAVAIGLLVSATLLRKGWVKLQESASVVVTALEIGVISSQTIEQLDKLPSGVTRVTSRPLGSYPSQ